MTYTVEVTREGSDWLASVTTLEGVNTWATTFAGLDHNVREAIALAEDLPEGAEDSLSLEWHLEDASDEVNDALRVAAQRRSLMTQQKANEKEVPIAVNVLAKQHWSTRDQAALFGMTHGRVSQLAKTSDSGRDETSSH